jgi:hypothetical protein
LKLFREGGLEKWLRNTRHILRPLSPRREYGKLRNISI